MVVAYPGEMQDTFQASTVKADEEWLAGMGAPDVASGEEPRGMRRNASPVPMLHASHSIGLCSSIFAWCRMLELGTHHA